MEFSFLLKGLLIGFSIAAPVGPIGVLCIRRTLADGQLSGLLSGLGAATADVLYSCISGFGITLVSNFLIDQQTWIRLFGGLFLCFLGIKTLLIKPPQESAAVKKRDLLGTYASTFLLTLTNPITILSFMGIFTGFGLATSGGDYGSAGILVLGVFCGSAAWWLLLSSIVSIFRTKFTLTAMQWVNRISGVIILGFGINSLLNIR